MPRGRVITCTWGKDASWLTGNLDGEKDLRPVYEATKFLPSFHLEHYTQAMIPGSDAPSTAAVVHNGSVTGPARKKGVKREVPLAEQWGTS